jgi:pimeloyl-ACP methyl ester carboxylesterase
VKHPKSPTHSARLTATVAVLVVAVLILVSGAANAGTRLSRSHPPTPKPTIVLIHGAWADASSWNRVVSRLQHDGYTVDAPPDPLRGLASDSAYVASYLKTISGPIVLVGHSYGGAVITDAATGNAHVRALVYIDAFVPDQGQTVQQLVAATPGSCLGGGGDPTKVFNFAQDPSLPAGDFDLYLKWGSDGPYPGFRACFANDLPGSVAATLQSTQRPLALGAITEASGPPAWKSTPSWYLLGTDDRVIPPAEQLSMAHRAGATILKVDASHLSMISHPAAATQLIIEAANATR